VHTVWTDPSNSDHDKDHDDDDDSAAADDVDDDAHGAASTSTAPRASFDDDDEEDRSNPIHDEDDDNSQKQESNVGSWVRKSGKKKQRQRAWDDFFQLLLQYRLEHNGDLDVPQIYEATKNDGTKVKLGRWVHKQRQHLRLKPDSERSQKLKRIGFLRASPRNSRRRYSNNIAILRKRTLPLALQKGSAGKTITAPARKNGSSSPTFADDANRLVLVENGQCIEEMDL
jgi:Helicase associated domain